MAGKAKGGSSRKIGRNHTKCANYKSRGRREANKVRKAETRAKRFARAAERRLSPNFIPVGRKTKIKRGSQLTAVVEKREAQAERIVRKRVQRRNFSGLTRGMKRLHTEHGIARAIPALWVEKGYDSSHTLH